MLLNDDRVGRALDRLFDAERASLLTQLMLGVICEFHIVCSQLHNDSTSITLPIPSSEGYRIVWVRSSQKTRTDADIRQQRIERGLHPLTALNERLAGPQSRLSDRASVEQAATAALAGAHADRWITVTVSETITETRRQEKRGRPGKDTCYRKITRSHWHVDHQVDADKVAYDASSDGCFPLIGNDREMTDPELLIAYRYQPHLEKRHHQLKSVQHAAPGLIHKPERIEALFLCQYIALLACCLIERDLRNAVAHAQVPSLPLYPEQRDCAPPTADRPLELFAGVARHHLTSNAQHVRTFPPQLTALQQQLLDLLNIPTPRLRRLTPQGHHRDGDANAIPEVRNVRSEARSLIVGAGPRWLPDGARSWGPRE